MPTGQQDQQTAAESDTHSSIEKYWQTGTVCAMAALEPGSPMQSGLVGVFLARETCLGALFASHPRVPGTHLPGCDQKE